MIVGSIIRHAPVVGSFASFVTTAKKVYNASTPSGACWCAVKGIVIDCTPLVIKCSVLCAALVGTTVGTLATGNPLLASAACQCGEAVLEELL